MTTSSGPRVPIRWRRPAVVVRTRYWSQRASLRATLVLAAMLVLSFGLAVLALGVGKYAVSPAAVLDVLLGRDHSFNRVVVLEWRAPRVVLALLIGAALGLSGAIFQALTRNPLGSPDVIGFNTGAYTGALVVIGVLGTTDYYLKAVGALVGGLLVAALVYGLARKRGVVQGYRLIVVGIAVGATLNAVNQWIITRIDIHAAISAAVWEQGSLNGLTWAQAVPVTVALLVLALLLVRLGPSLGMMQMGDDAAGALGVAPERVRVALFVLGVALVALAAAAAGPISFVALAAPQIARRLTAAPGVTLLASAVTGATLLLLSDLIALRVLAPTQLPVGAVTVCLGGVYLIYLLISQARGGRL